MNNKLIQLFQDARHDQKLTVVEGFHALKHAVRFDAAIDKTMTSNKAKLLKLANKLAPDIKAWIASNVDEVDRVVFASLSPRPPRTGVIAIAKRNQFDLDDVIVNAGSHRIVWLENPADAENVGAVVRVAAAAGIDAVITTGDMDSWQSAALRGSAGLHFALPVISTKSAKPFDYGHQVIAFDPEGKNVLNQNLPDSAILVFGNEREGISQQLKTKADYVVSLPMREHVSSLNLATSVAAAVYIQLVRNG